MPIDLKKNKVFACNWKEINNNYKFFFKIIIVIIIIIIIITTSIIVKPCKILSTLVSSF